MSKLFTIVSGEADLNKLVSSALASSKKHANIMHSAVLSCLVKAAEGGIHALNRLARPNGLTTNELTTLKLYVRRFQTETDKEGRETPSHMRFLEFKNKEFALLPDTNKQRASFIDFAKKVLTDPVGDHADWFFGARNNLAIVRYYGIDDIVGKIDAIVAEVEGKRANIKVAIPAKAKAELLKFKAMFDNFASSPDKVNEGAPKLIKADAVKPRQGRKPLSETKRPHTSPSTTEAVA